MPRDIHEILNRLMPEIRSLTPDGEDDVSWLEENWQRVSTSVFGQLDAQLSQLRQQAAGTGLLEVLSTNVDLLSPLKQEWREVAHTQALAYFLTPIASHGLGGTVLQALLQHLARLAHNYAFASKYKEHLEPAQAKAALAYVEPEVPYENTAGADRGRTDLWIEIPRNAPELLVIVEMKLGMAATSNQLERYERVINARATKLGLPPNAVIKVLLSYEYFSPRIGWLAARWRNLAATLAPLSKADSDGARLLRFYLATHLIKLEGLSVNPTNRRDAMRLCAFLDAALRHCI